MRGIYQGINLFILLYLATTSFYLEGLEVTFYLRLQFNCHLNWKWLQSVRIGVPLNLSSMQFLLTGWELKKAGKSPQWYPRQCSWHIPHTDSFPTCLRQRAPNAVQQQDSLPSKTLYSSVTPETATANWRPKKQLSHHLILTSVFAMLLYFSFNKASSHWPN